MRVSIIIPVYNAEKYLKDCINSVLSQTFTDYEIVLVNDGSTDGSESICNDYVERYEFITCYHIKNSGPGFARNLALSKANGEFVQFLDSDDRLDTDALQFFNECAEKYASDLYIASSTILNEKEKIIGEISNKDKCGFYEIKSVLNKLNGENKPFFLHYIWNKWYRKDLIDKFHIKFNESIRIGEDFLFNCEYYKICKTVYVLNKNLHFYYIRNNDSLTHKFRKDEFERRIIMDSEFIKLFKLFNIFNENIDTIYAMIGDISCDSLFSIYNDDCDYDRKNRIIFMKKFLESDYYNYIIKFFELNNTNNRKEKIKRVLIKNRCYKFIDAYFVIRKKKW